MRCQKSLKPKMLIKRLKKKSSASHCQLGARVPINTSLAQEILALHPIHNVYLSEMVLKVNTLRKVTLTATSQGKLKRYKIQSKNQFNSSETKRLRHFWLQYLWLDRNKKQPKMDTKFCSALIGLIQFQINLN